MDKKTSKHRPWEHFFSFPGASRLKIQINFVEISKGFGFVSCANQDTFNRVINQQHSINGRKLDINQAFIKRDFGSKSNNDRCKVFIGGLRNEITNG